MTEIKTAAQLATESGIGKKTRTPRNFDTILKGALALTLKERADLVKQVTAANQEEAKVLKQQADEAAGLVS